MYKQRGQFHFSPSDLTRYMESPFASWMDRFSIEHPDQAPEKDPADSKNWADWSNYAESLMIEKDHLFQVATITKGQIKKLNQAGINTMQELATNDIEYVQALTR